MNRLFTLTILIATSLLIGCENDSESFEPNSTDINDILDGWEISKITYDYDLPYQDMFFVNPEVGFAVGTYEGNGYTQAEIYKTVNAGQSWQNQNLRTELFPGSVYFLNEQIGFVSGRQLRVGGFLLKTQNGGETWNEILTDDYVGIEPLHFWDEFHGVAFVSVPKTSIPFGIAIVKTADGGENWEIMDLAIRPGSEFHDVIDDVVFVGGQNQKVYKITNFGNSWEVIDTPIVSEAIVHNIYFCNENFGFVEGAETYKTMDGGHNWNRMDFPNSISAYHGSFHFYDESEGFFIENVFEYGNSFDQVSVVGNIVYQTFDGGETWNQSEEIEPLGIRFSHFPQRSIGYGYNPNTREFYTIRKK